MKCPKCSYVSFDYFDACKRCGQTLGDVRTRLQIIAVSPEDRAPAVAAAAADVEPLPSVSPVEPLTSSGPDDVLGNLDFEESFDDMVEPTRHGEGRAEGKDKEELLDLDFGDIFGDEGKKN